MRIIFLDIDGVLNCQSSKSRCTGLLGIDKDKVRKLRAIVEKTGARIILCSSWKDTWEKTDKDNQHILGNYLDRKLKRENLFIFDKTLDNGSNRGSGIKDWIFKNTNIESWIVIDDEIFNDYHKCDVLKHLVKTDFYVNNGGIQDIHVREAIELLV